MDELYDQQQTVGIYSFIDDLLTTLPIPSNSSSSTTDHRRPYSSLLDDYQLGPTGMDLSRLSELRQRHERLRAQTRLDLATFGRYDFVRDRPRRPRGTSRNDPTWLGQEEESTSSDSDEDCEESVGGGEEEESTSPGGYPDDIFLYLSDRDREEFVCTICYCIIKNAYQCLNEHKFCYGCIYTWANGENSGHDRCPTCRCNGLYAKDRMLTSRINRKRVCCPEKSCNWIGVLTDYTSHEHGRYSPSQLVDQLSSTNDDTQSVRGQEDANQSKTVKSPQQQASDDTHQNISSDDIRQNSQSQSTSPVPHVDCTRLKLKPLLHNTIVINNRGASNRPNSSRSSRQEYDQPNVLIARSNSRPSSSVDDTITQSDDNRLQTPSTTESFDSSSPIRPSIQSTSCPEILPNSTDSIVTDATSQSDTIHLPMTENNPPIPASRPTRYALVDSRSSSQNLTPTLNSSSTRRESDHHQTVGSRIVRPTPARRDQLHFRRLATRQPGQLVDQLRETRQHLHAMIQLLSLELTERRQQVMTTRLEVLNRIRMVEQITEEIDSEFRHLATPTSENHGLVDNDDGAISVERRLVERRRPTLRLPVIDNSGSRNDRLRGESREALPDLLASHYLSRRRRDNDPTDLNEGSNRSFSTARSRLIREANRRNNLGDLRQQIEHSLRTSTSRELFRTTLGGDQVIGDTDRYSTSPDLVLPLNYSQLRDLHHRSSTTTGRWYDPLSTTGSLENLTAATSSSGGSSDEEERNDCFWLRLGLSEEDENPSR